MGQCFSVWTESDLTDDSKKCPYGEHCEGKTLGFWLFGVHLGKWGKNCPDVVAFIGRRFGLDLSPLERIFAPNNGGTMEDWESAAQPPAELASCLRSMIQFLEDTPSWFDEIEAIPEDRREYFSTRHFLDDLRGLLRKSEWAEEIGDKRVRLYYG